MWTTSLYNNAIIINIATSGTEIINWPSCFLQHQDSMSLKTEISSINDKAGIDGNFLYGGLMDRCIVRSFYETPFAQFALTVRSDADGGARNITSKPYEFCLCPYLLLSKIKGFSRVFCQRLQSVQIYRGQMFTVSLQAITLMGTTSTTVTAITSSRARLEIYQTSQPLPDYCHSLPYTLYSTDSHEELVLYPDGPCRDTGNSRVVIDITLLPCPDGFTQSGELCTCEERLQHYRVNCTIDDVPYFTKIMDSNFWIGVPYRHILWRPSPGQVLSSRILQGRCR